MNRKRITWWAFVTIVTLCTFAALPSFAPQATAQDNDLTETFTDAAGGIMLNYPAGWFVEGEFGFITIANTPDGIESDLDTLPPGIVVMSIVAVTPDDVAEFGAETALDLLAAVMFEAESDPDTSNLTEPLPLEGLPYNAVQFTATVDVADIIAIAMLTDEQNGVMIVAGAPTGELADHEATILAIARSIEFIEPGSVAGIPMGVPENNAVQWETETVSLTADNFYIVAANGQVFTAAVADVDIDGDPGWEEYTTLEITWKEHGAPMRVYLYFKADGKTWHAFEIRTYDGSSFGEWVYFEGDTFNSPLGQAYAVLSFGRSTGAHELVFENLSIQAFTTAEAAVVPDTVTEAPGLGDLVAGLDTCNPIATSIQAFSSEYGDGYAPSNLLDGDPTTGWSSAGYDEVETITIGLGGMQTVHGVRFNSYSASAGYETDSIKDFTISTGDRLLYEGQAALAEGYQDYTFDPVQADQLTFTFTSTHGGGYFEASDILICGSESSADGTVRQWASSAEATSQFSDPEWSAAQATGAPDTGECGDITTAWASAAQDSQDQLRLYYAQAVVPTQINIYQTYTPGAIVQVQVITAEGEVIDLPNSADPVGDGACPRIFTLDLDGSLPPVDGIVIHLDQSLTGNWNEIDAVELVGTAP